MALQVWLPLNGNLDNQGLDDVTIVANNSSYQNDGKIGECLKLGYTNNFTIPSMVGAKQMTIAYWCRVNTATETNWLDPIHFYSTDGNETYVSRHEFFANCKNTGFWYKGGSIVMYSSPIVIGEWNHFAFTFNYTTGETSFYLNGSLFQTRTDLDTTHYITGIDFRLGENGLDVSENDVRVYDNCLSSREIKEISKGLVLHYPLSMPGQENLVKQSNQFRVGGHAAKITPSLLEDGTYQVIVESGNSNYTSSWWMTMDGVENNFVEDEVFTVSFTIKSSDANTTTPPRIYLKSGMGYFPMIGKVTASWSTVYYTGLWKKENSLSPHLGWSGLVGTYQILNWKIEKGSRPTPWIPNHADAEYFTLGFDDGIEYDVSGYGHNGTKVGTITYDADTPRYNTSAVLDETYITLAGITDQAISQFSVCGWVNLLTGYTANYGCHLINFSKTYCRICVSKDGVAVRLLLTDGTTNYFGSSAMSASSLSANVWNHYAVTFDNGSIKIYINGELDTSRTATITSISPGRHWTIGNHGTTESPKAKVSDVRFYTTSLSPDDILELYHTSASLADNGTLMAYEFNET